MIYIQKSDLPEANFAPNARLYADRGWLPLAREAMPVIGSSTIQAIREDAGLLRIELSCPTHEQTQAFHAIQARSAAVCGICGQPGTLRYDGLKNGKPAGWHRTRCDQHIDRRSDDELYQRELRRREAFRNIRWTNDLATRHAALRELRDIQELDTTNPLVESISLDEVREIVPIHPRADSSPCVLSEEIPEPWRTRFWTSSLLSITTMGHGVYAHDWQNFTELWEAEHRDLANKLLDLDDD